MHESKAEAHATLGNRPAKVPSIYDDETIMYMARNGFEIDAERLERFGYKALAQMSAVKLAWYIKHRSSTGVLN